ncbi:Ger(x)C family spore germination protein [Paenibacillus sp. 1011MAR3C5]|uniref:Ger(x)C family spore germination protein n=1 Tax=Paenibacillus sp. 1011MAR3C5 TaxID=1675787 RepID=UPI000E6B938E|nr:Ger(x)C family spore germination protein [Paenibacillus sp. 1011MAR3C5]RJE88484.1 Ger(x)C family spore germination protein [Paenibacillus sp. 1011MAR3C5]
MMRAKQIGIFILICLLTGGCARLPEIQNMAYATAIGVDYVNGKWIAYAQILNFATVARTEQVALGKSVPVWVGEGKGDTLALALTDVGRTAQLRLFWGHVKVVVMSENAMRLGVNNVYGTINRYREVRYNVLVYGTKRPIKDILTQKSILNLSPLDTAMFTTSQMSSVQSIVLPVTGNRIIAYLNEKGQAAYIPSIDFDDVDWTEDKKPKPMYMISGAYFFRDLKMTDWMSAEELMGVRWSDERLERTPIEVDRDGEAVATIMFEHPKMRIRPYVEDGEPRFDIRVSTDGYVMEIVQDTDMEKLSRFAEEDIRKEIELTYRNGLRIKSDPFGLGQLLYRNKPKEFRRIIAGKPYFLKHDSIKKIDVRVHLMTTGKYKGTKP